MVATVLYVAVYQLAYQGLYLEGKEADGVLRFQLQPPTVDSCNLFDAGCEANYTPISETAYCAQTNGSYPGNKYDCAFYDDSDIGIFFDSSMLVATRISEYHQTRNCSITDSPNTCTQPWTLNGCTTNDPDDPACQPTLYYVASAEQFTVLFDHHLSVVEFDMNEESHAMTGMIRVSSGGDDNLCVKYGGTTSPWGVGSTDTAPCYISPNTTDTNLDYISLDVLMRAAGASIDKVSDQAKVYRDSGVSIIVNIRYMNRRDWKSPEKPRYVYEIRIQEDSSYKYYRNVFDVTTTNRTVWNMHGVRINTIQSGEIKKFNFNNLLLQLTTSLTLLAMATVVTDMLLCYALPDREVYTKEKFHLTEDMTDYRDRLETGAVGEPRASMEHDASYKRLVDSEGSGHA
uniref:Purinergic receptor n=1 Tax=Phaeomonas parva TaxID=124430 RepID=A0A7S1U0M3_9STRA|mmetsp:Transcript_25657/g.80319  ORF Transcript_25657/g.80319 Transcript_25657/m.80319 type:complete len:401 (+) Transcript_25657:217-1419(+)